MEGGPAEGRECWLRPKGCVAETAGAREGPKQGMMGSRLRKRAGWRQQMEVMVQVRGDVGQMRARPRSGRGFRSVYPEELRGMRWGLAVCQEVGVGMVPVHQGQGSRRVIRPGRLCPGLEE